ncbi:hypothetical protein F7725_001645 [Dissostichus mawsoni]|uniref:Uncharacterized protein n=1 Tax=Dissostichus mawsoni TaxID=36200 RepID=A0A7J5Y091_DISMA|nr:hypothetical protein F7725_001645 [Dissostichus mawsoni]
MAKLELLRIVTFLLQGDKRVLGCIDCTHIPISACLGDNEGDYVNRKSLHSLNIQASCDHRSHEACKSSQALRQSGLGQSMTQGSSLSLHCVTNSSRVWQLYILIVLCFLSCLLCTYYGNVPLSSGHFSGVLLGDRVAPERDFRIITACVVLHNIATMRKERAPPANPQPPDVVDPITLDYPTGRAPFLKEKEKKT